MQSRKIYGPRRVQPELREQGLIAGRDRIGRLRRELGLRWKQGRKFRAGSAEPGLGETDIKYVPTGEG